VAQGFLQRCPKARIVTILDSVAGALKLAQVLRERFPSQLGGNVHGFSSEEERSATLRRQFSVWMTTIGVGIDFSGERSSRRVLPAALLAA